jgi:integrase
MIQVLMLTGQRLDEVLATVRSEFDFAARVWTLPGERTKNGREHQVSLVDGSMISARLAITSPEKGCGKTTLLDVLRLLGRSSSADIQRNRGGDLPRRRDDEAHLVNG